MTGPTPEERIARHRAKREAGPSPKSQEVKTQKRPGKPKRISIGLIISGILLIPIAVSIGKCSNDLQKKWSQEDQAKRAKLEEARQVAKLAKIAEINRQELLKIRDISMRFLDGLKVASQTGRIALSGPVTRMQDVARELDNVNTGVCVTPAKQRLRAGMTEVVDGFLTFMDSSNPEESSSSQISSGMTEIKASVEQGTQCTNIEHLRQFHPARTL